MLLRLAAPLLILAPVALLAYAPPPDPDAAALAAADTSHVNLQVFPSDIPHEQLIQAMRGFTRALGVRCDHCHVRNGEDFDFPSDENPHKEVAREMMRMNRRINMELLASIEGLHEAEGWRVTCWTCHRGETTPATRWPDEEAPEDGPPPAPADSTHDHGDHEHDDGHDDHDHDGDGG
jgi:hypothetical protein